MTPIYAFTGGADGANPAGGLIQGSDGSFYGKTNGGDGHGSVFQITPAGVFKNLYTFTGGTDGSYPDPALAQGSDGNFYGTTDEGGASEGDGTVFQITPAGVVSVSATAAESSGSIAQVEFFVNNASAGKVTAAQSGAYTLSIPLQTAGQFALTAIATDANGLSQASAPVIVNVAPQAVTIAVTGNGEAVAGGQKGQGDGHTHGRHQCAALGPLQDRGRGRGGC